MLGSNMFAYCLNNPVNGMDPTGRMVRTVCPGPQLIPPETILEMIENSALIGENDPTSTIRDVTDEVDRALAEWSVKLRNIRCLTNMLPFFSFILWPFAEADIYLKFYNLVKDGAPWDIKYADNWAATIGTEFPGEGVQVMYHGMLMTPEQIGNYTYGYLGAAFGIPYRRLLFGSYFAAGFPTGSDAIHEFGDWIYISLGYGVHRCDYG